MSPKVMSQADHRTYETFRDQHGRFWGANVERATMEPCEVLCPQGWTAPVEPAWAKGLFMPPEDVVVTVPRNDRAKRGYGVFVDYVLWLQKWDARDIDHLKKLHAYARGMGKDTTPAQITALIQNPTPDLKEAVGKSPYDRIPRDFILAMAANNKWALGQSNAIPAKALAVLEALKPTIIAAKERAKIGDVDPFEDEDDGQEFVGAMAMVADPLGDDADVLEAQFDPNALGGKKVPVVTGKAVGGGKAKGKAKADD